MLKYENIIYVLRDLAILKKINIFCPNSSINHKSSLNNPKKYKQLIFFVPKTNNLSNKWFGVRNRSFKVVGVV
jgi:hypothetical protein